MNVLNIKYGLFNVSFWKHPILWMKDYKIYRERKKFLLKNGYSPVCQWEYYETILALSEQIFTWLKSNRYSDIPFEGGTENSWNDMNNAFYDKLLEDIATMKDYDNLFDDPEKVVQNKKHFFEQLEKYFYHLWD